MAGEVEAVWQQLHDLRIAEHNGDRRVVHVRITVDAIEGSITTVPLTPERIRAMGFLTATPDGVIADEGGRLVEILMHPVDFAWLRRSAESRGVLETGGLDRIFGIPVRVDVA